MIKLKRTIVTKIKVSPCQIIYRQISVKINLYSIHVAALLRVQTKLRRPLIPIQVRWCR